MEQQTNLETVDHEREENLPPSELLNLTLGLVIAVGIVLFAGVGTILEAANGGNVVAGGLIGAVIGFVLAIVLVNVSVGRLRSKEQ